MGFLQGKRALITGIASQRSIATGIAEAMHRQGAELALTYQTEKLGDVFARFGDYISGETLAVRLLSGAVADGLLVELPEGSVRLTISKA